MGAASGASRSPATRRPSCRRAADRSQPAPDRPDLPLYELDRNDATLASGSEQRLAECHVDDALAHDFRTGGGHGLRVAERGFDHVGDVAAELRGLREAVAAAVVVLPVDVAR